METILCVVGAGAMGAQIAHQAALHGVPVRLYSRSRERLDGATAQCGGLLRKRVEKGKLTPGECPAATAPMSTTTDSAARTCRAPAAVKPLRHIGKSPVLVERESFGFVANRILFIAMQEAFSLVEKGYVSVEDCDLAVRNGLGWPMGPFALADLVGLDVTEAILEEGHRQTGEERWAAPALLHDRVARGELGRKSGRGFTLPG